MEKQLTKFTFYDLYAELMATLTDEERGKQLRAMCAYVFEDAPHSFTDKKLVVFGEHCRHPLRGQRSAGKRVPMRMNIHMGVMSNRLTATPCDKEKTL